MRLDWSPLQSDEADKGSCFLQFNSVEAKAILAKVTHRSFHNGVGFWSGERCGVILHNVAIGVDLPEREKILFFPVS